MAGPRVVADHAAQGKWSRCRWQPPSFARTVFSFELASRYQTPQASATNSMLFHFERAFPAAHRSVDQTEASNGRLARFGRIDRRTFGEEMSSWPRS
jgi:hypothetical protein